MGSWKIIEISLPRMRRISLSLALTRSLPLNRTRPPTMRPGGEGMSRMMALQVTLLPEPDSPTMPRVPPRSSENDTPSTARTTEPSVRKCTWRSWTSSSLSAISLS
jgi:hypothetical protein